MNHVTHVTESRTVCLTHLQIYSLTRTLTLSVPTLLTHSLNPLFTEQVTVEVRSPFAGRIIETFSEQGDEINVGEPLFVIEPTSGDAPAAAAPAAAADVKAVAAVPVAPAHAPKAAAPTAAPASAKTPAAAPAKAAPAPLNPTPAPAVSGNRGETRVKMTRMRLRIAQVLYSTLLYSTALLPILLLYTYCSLSFIHPLPFPYLSFFSSFCHF
jgi:pyruvate/2-oxoglutarate dehydrogenase complex dihydrolipoamide acyltransferase (E2) component